MGKGLILDNKIKKNFLHSLPADVEAVHRTEKDFRPLIQVPDELVNGIRNGYCD